jgi:general secretion pathway protein J
MVKHAMTDMRSVRGIRGGRGFTLIELLVAISILAIIAVLGWRGLDSIVRARIALTHETEQSRGMQLAFAQLQSDCAHGAAIADLGGRSTLMAEQERLTLVRTVFADNQATRYQVVAYRVKDGVLTRRESIPTRDLLVLDTVWQAAIADTDTSSVPVNLQSGVLGMTAQVWFNDNPGWRAANSTQAKPAATVAAVAPGTLPPPVPAPVGLEVSMQLRGMQSAMVKAFLLGAG